MKKLFFVAIATVGFAVAGNAQETAFGVKAGVDFASMKVKYDFGPGLSGEATASETGFFVGGFVTLGISEKFAVQPEVLYVSLPDDMSFISVPVLAKLTLAESFHVMAGPSFNYFLNAEEDEFKVNIDLGGSFDITENLDVNAKYSLGFGDVSISGVFVGAGYKF